MKLGFLFFFNLIIKNEPAYRTNKHMFLDKVRKIKMNENGIISVLLLDIYKNHENINYYSSIKKGNDFV